MSPQKSLLFVNTCIYMYIVRVQYQSDASYNAQQILVFHVLQMRLLPLDIRFVTACSRFIHCHV